MAEVIHHENESSSSGMGFIFGIIVLVILGIILFYYGLPALRGGGGTQGVNPGGGASGSFNVTTPQQ